jgi:Concanavalin A-like lectin/glucanases superfamily
MYSLPFARRMFAHPASVGGFIAAVLACGACSSSTPTTPGGVAGAPAGSSGASTGGTSSAGASGSGVGGTTTAGTTGAGGNPAASGGSAGASGSAAGGTSGSAGAAGTAGSTGGTGGGTGGGGGAGGGTAGGGGSMPCAGNALNLSSNIPGGADPAMSRVMVDFANSADLPVANGARTIEFWAYVLANSWVGENNTIYEYGNQVGANAGFGLDFGGTRATMDPYTNGTCDRDNLPISINATMSMTPQWVHFAMVYDLASVRLYANGILAQATQPCTLLNTSRTQLTIGGNPRGSYFNGQIDEFRVWTVARTAGEIMATMNKRLVGNETGLGGYWRFDDAVGATTAVDSTTTGGHTAHIGMLMAATNPQRPTFVPSTAPITCP